jgi:serine/threonine protein phosphatase PrpC
MKITSTGRTHVGMKRSHNEDCLKIYRDGNLLVVADGMGGHSSGEVASELSAETLISFYRSSALDDEMTWPYKYNYQQSYQENRMRIGIELSNYKVHSSSAQDPSLKGMGTTMVAICFYDDQFSIGHVGDSRVYRWRAGELKQLTEDHSLLNDFIKMRPEGMSAKEIEAFPHKNIIVRALGMRDTVQVDVITDDLMEGDLFLLCSDGLSGMITDADINQMLSENLKKQLSLDLICERLIQEANKNGGTDNITVILARAEGENSQEEASDDNISPSWDLPKEETPETREVSLDQLQEALQVTQDQAAIAQEEPASLSQQAFTERLNSQKEPEISDAKHQQTPTSQELTDIAVTTPSISDLPTIKLMPTSEDQPLKQPTPVPLSNAEKTTVEEQKQGKEEDAQQGVEVKSVVFDSVPNVDKEAETMKFSAQIHQQLLTPQKSESDEGVRPSTHADTASMESNSQAQESINATANQMDNTDDSPTINQTPSLDEDQKTIQITPKSEEQSTLKIIPS